MAREKIQNLPPNVTIACVTPTTLPAYRRIISTILPIRYPDSFYHDSISPTSSSTIALCALWHPPSPSIPSPDPIVVGGIQCRLAPVPSHPSSLDQVHKSLYIQTLATLAPYRRLGVGSALLRKATWAAVCRDGGDGVRDIYAHVWEANKDALEWYAKEGFAVEDGVVEGYYTKLRPSGARVVRRRIGVYEFWNARESWESHGVGWEAAEDE
ncbi:hypothetical protein N7G274_004530 [Stereocaulon virgatum]|uniref:N-acetyltransferase domain-containing protein n=1 Tax=Stereocaulon virgatum TaxID=373712 RepID=A0ABR4AD51_9LECA